MGAQRVLQAAVGLIVATRGVACLGVAEAAAGERVAVIDLGPSDPAARERLDAAIAAAGLELVTGDGVDEALAGREVDRDAAPLAVALATAQRAFGALACAEVATAAQQAIGIAAARQAAGRPVPELPRAWTYVLLCADREDRRDAAHVAADQLRALGGRPDGVPAAVWAKYPEIDAVANRELVPLEVDADVAGAAIWIDFKPVGTAPVRVVLPAGEHVIAAASGRMRGWAAGTAIRSQPAIRVPLVDATGAWTEVARRVAGWRGERPAASELAWALERVHARIALVRRGDTIEAWGQIGREPPRPIGSAEPARDASHVLGLVVNRVRTWTERAPDPDRPLLVEDGSRRRDGAEQPTRWWVYAAIAGAAAVAAGVLYFEHSGSDRQRVELHYP